MQSGAQNFPPLALFASPDSNPCVRPVRSSPHSDGKCLPHNKLLTNIHVHMKETSEKILY